MVKPEAEAEPKKQPVLAWIRNPVDCTQFNDCPLNLVPRLDPRLAEVLKTKLGISSLFPVQVAVWYETIGPGLFERDICVNSPTGSGKTLAYALPIVQMLANSSVRSLRALVVLPTRDLTLQVKEVFAAIAPAMGLSVASAVGQSSIAEEISALTKRSMLDACACYDDDDYFSQSNSSVDILVATPGRLMDHISSTKGFTLEHLRYLVVDETDRLLREAYQSWLPTVVKLTQSSDAFSDSHSDASFLSAFGSFKTIRKCGVERGFKDRPYPRLAKMVLSATLTQDPSKLAQLDLHHPLLVTTGQERYLVPEKLESFKLVCETVKKPLFLVALLQNLSGEKCIVFTSSVESTHRLCMLLKLFGDLHVKIKEYSGLQHQRVRSKTLEAFRKGVVQVLVSSDAITRGTDIEGVRNVINYDKPPYVKTYIHRAGRTARAGQAGRCFTLLSKSEVKSFEKLLQKADIKLWTDYSLPSGSVNALEPLYSSALEKLKENLDAETSKKRRFNLKSTGRSNGRSNRS